MKTRLCCTLLAVILICSMVPHICPTASALEHTGTSTSSVVNPHTYEAVPGDATWETMSLQERVSSCTVSEKEVISMTTAALVETVLNYPYIVNIYAYDSLATGIAAVSDYFPGLPVLLGRRDAIVALSSWIAEKELCESASNTAENFQLICAQSLLSYLNGVSQNTVVQPLASVAYLYTPKGSQVTVFVGLSWSDQATSYTYQESLRLQYLAVYPSIEEISGIDSNYNCHSYTFFSISPSNNFWINDPSAYLEDGSYVSSNYMTGDCVVYRDENDDITHSAIISTNGMVPVLVSKWGCNAVFKHSLTDCPYAIEATYQAYKLA